MEYKIEILEETSDKSIWSINDSDIERIAGGLAIAIPILEDINNSANSNGKIYHINSEADVSEYRILGDIEVEYIANYINIPISNYAIWIKSADLYRYSLFKFKSPKFLQGLASMCQWADVKLGSYVHDLPFDSKGNRYDLYGYSLRGGRTTEDAFDLNDVEEDEYDNENLLEPYRDVAEDWDPV